MHDAVFRTNFAPIAEKYAADIGTKTTHMFLDFAAVKKGDAGQLFKDKKITYVMAVRTRRLMQASVERLHSCAGTHCRLFSNLSATCVERVAEAALAR
jgi:hypothetical protein